MFFSSLGFTVSSPVGQWTSIDDKTGEKRAVILLSEAGGTLSGTVEKIYARPGDTGICSECPGKFKDQPIQGMRIVWGLKDEGSGVWSGGSILDPKSGRIYKAKMTLDGSKLYLRGYIGVAIIGRTQVWVK